LRIDFYVCSVSSLSFILSLSSFNATIFADYPEHKYTIIENEHLASEFQLYGLSQQKAIPVTGRRGP
jgi:hypothetical protein